MISVDTGAATHPGRVRSRNEDAMLNGPYVFAVADGMGGHDAGDVAARTLVSTLEPVAHNSRLARRDVLSAIRTGDDRIHELARTTTSGMGTTITGVALTGGDDHPLLVFNVGDSRVYRLRGDTLSRLTHDHSVVQELIDAGVISTEAARTHPERNVITRAIGTGERPDIDWWQLRPSKGDRMLITSDGLLRELEMGEITSILLTSENPQQAADALVDAAVEAGGRDNITVVVIDIKDTGPVTWSDDGLDVDTADRPLTQQDDIDDAEPHFDGPAHGHDQMTEEG